MVVAVCGRGERGWILNAARAILSRKIEGNWPGLGEKSPIKGAGGPRAAAVALGCGAVIGNSLFRPTVEKDMEEVSVSKGTNHLVESNGPKDLAVAAWQKPRAVSILGEFLGFNDQFMKKWA